MSLNFISFHVVFRFGYSHFSFQVVLHSLHCTFTSNNKIVIAQDNDGRIYIIHWQCFYVKKKKFKKKNDGQNCVRCELWMISSVFLFLRTLLNHSRERVAFKPNGSWPYSWIDCLRICSKIPYCFVWIYFYVHSFK